MLRRPAFPKAQSKNARPSAAARPLFPLHSPKSILVETERYLRRVTLVFGKNQFFCIGQGFDPAAKCMPFLQLVIFPGIIDID